MEIVIPELLAPAGCLERLKMACEYGADAIYLGGQKFGLRSAAENFSESEIVEGVRFAHAREKKVYVVLNSFMHDDEIKELPPFLKFLEQTKVDGVICSDPGVIKTVRDSSSLEIHLSTQASCNNSSSGMFWKDLGVTRLILGRESSIEQAKRIKELVGIEIEMFIHGSMCISYSGNCIISNFTAGRDSNRGGCAQSCRFEYSLNNIGSELTKNSFFLSSKDLMGIMLVDKFIEAGIDSIKIEGRMKSALYLGTVVKTYRKALDLYREGPFQDSIEGLLRELNRVTHREYCSGNLLEPAELSSVYADRESELKEYGMVGVVVDRPNDKEFLVEVRGPFKKDDILEVIPFIGDPILINAIEATGPFNEELTKFSPGMLIKLPGGSQVLPLNIIRVKIS